MPALVLHRKLAATHGIVTHAVAQPVQSTLGRNVNFNDFVEQSCDTELLSCSVLQLCFTVTCSNAYIEAATIGLSWAMVMPSKIVVTAAAAVVHTALMKSKQSRAPPAVGVSCCPVRASTRAGTTACVVDSVLLAARWVCVRMCHRHVLPRHVCHAWPRNAPQPRVTRCAVSHPARCPMACATCVRWRLKIGRVVVTDGRVRVWLGRQ